MACACFCIGLTVDSATTELLFLKLVVGPSCFSSLPLAATPHMAPNLSPRHNHECNNKLIHEESSKNRRQEKSEGVVFVNKPSRFDNEAHLVLQHASIVQGCLERAEPICISPDFDFPSAL